MLLLRGRLRSWYWQHVALISAILIRATPRRAFLGRLLQQERRAALRALFDHRFVPIDDFTLGVLGAAVENLAALGSLDDDFALTTGTRTSDPGSLAFDVFALRIIRAGDEFAKPSLTFHQLSVINRALFIQHFRRRRDLAAPGNLADVATVGITRTAIKRAKPAAL